ncbi:MAG: DNRLRE domain-containing protein [Acidobacteriaceae bacterium]|nr:DNRLRE domain-containing protein [Acidobacteriaceae bacterium]
MLLGCGGSSQTSGATTTTTDTATPTTPNGFMLYDTSYFANSHSIFDNNGALHAAVVYSQGTWPGSCTSTGCANAPTQAEFDTVVEKYVAQFGSSNAIVFDFEDLVITKETSTAAANNAVALIQQLITWTRALYPNAKIGMYDYDFNTNYAPASSTGYNAIRAQLYQNNSASFDFFTPSMYQRWTTHAVWDQYLAQAIINDTAINVANALNKPIYPYISPFVSGTPNGTLLTDTEWTSELADLVSCNSPSSTACQAVMANVTAVSGDCSYSGSTTACSPINGGNLWAGAATVSLTSNTNWVMELLAIIPPPISSGVQYKITSYGQTGKCIDAGSSTVSTDTCGSAASQQWTFTPLASGNGTFSVSSSSYQQANLTTAQNAIWDGTSSTTALATLTSTGTPTAAQQWQVVSTSPGYYEFILLSDYATAGNTDSEACMTASTSGILTTSTCNGGVNQLFTLGFIVGSGSQSIAPSQNAFVEGGTDDATNYGTSVYLSVEDATGIYARNSYLQFDLTGVSGTIKKATVYLVATGVDAGTALDGAYTVSSNAWTTTSITWNNAPTFSTTEVGSWGLTAAAAGKPLFFDVTSAAVAAQSSGALSIGIEGTLANSVYHAYASSRSTTTSYQPMLVVSTQ